MRLLSLPSRLPVCHAAAGVAGHMAPPRIWLHFKAFEEWEPFKPRHGSPSEQKRLLHAFPAVSAEDEKNTVTNGKLHTPDAMYLSYTNTRIVKEPSEQKKERTQTGHSATFSQKTALQAQRKDRRGARGRESPPTNEKNQDERAMAKWHEHSASSPSGRHPVPMPPSNGSSSSSCAVGAGRPLLLRVRSGSLNALDKPPMMRSPLSPSTPAEEDEDDDEMGETQGQQRESMTSVMAAAAVAIPQFRSCHASSSKVTTNTSNNQAGVYGEWRIRRRGRSVSDNSSSSTSSLSSLSSSNSSGSNMSNPNGRPSLHQLSADVSAFRSGSMDSDDSMDGSLGFGSVVVAPALPRSPYPVDPYHFYCKPQVSAGSLLSDMTTLLNDCDVEYSVHAYKCKFKCVKYVHYSHVEFIVRVYSHQNALLVEFQRRSGSLLLWDGLYNILYHKLVDVVDPSASACSQSGGQKKVGAVRRDSLSAQIWRTISNQTPSSGVEAMKIMLTSKYVDAQREGCSGLAVLTEDAQSSYLVAKHDLVGGLVVAAESDDQDMARCAVGALANIANAIGSFANQQVADDTVAHVTRAAKIVVELVAKTPSDSRFSFELLRECARALCAFGRICAQQIMECEGHTQLLQLVNHRDAQLAAHCRDALQTLQLDV